MKTTTIFSESPSPKTKRRDAKRAARVAREEQAAAAAWAARLATAREGTVVIVTIAFCGGSPSNPQRWTTESAPRRALASDMRGVPTNAGGWQATHAWGWSGIACRLATAAEVAAVEALEESGARDPRPWRLFGGSRPYPPAPSYPGKNP